MVQAIEGGDLVCCGVLSGNRNFEGRIHPYVRANYLASPPLVVAYALAGTTTIDFETEPIGYTADKTPVFLKDIWPSHAEVADGNSVFLQLILTPSKLSLRTCFVKCL